MTQPSIMQPSISVGDQVRKSSAGKLFERVAFALQSELRRRRIDTSLSTEVSPLQDMFISFEPGGTPSGKPSATKDRIAIAFAERGPFVIFSAYRLNEKGEPQTSAQGQLKPLAYKAVRAENLSTDAIATFVGTLANGIDGSNRFKPGDQLTLSHIRADIGTEKLDSASQLRPAPQVKTDPAKPLSAIPNLLDAGITNRGGMLDGVPGDAGTAVTITPQGKPIVTTPVKPMVP